MNVKRSFYNSLVRLFLFLALLGAEVSMAADPSTSCPINVGDSLDKVKAFYKVEDEPKQETVPQLSYMYHFKQFGVYIFFDSSKTVKSLRFDPPFMGKFGGIAIGDSKEKLLQQRGRPAKTFQGYPDFTEIETRKIQQEKIVSSLPDPAPKGYVRNAISQILDIEHQPLQYLEAWLYNGASGFTRYDLNKNSGAVSIIFSSVGSDN